MASVFPATLGRRGSVGFAEAAVAPSGVTKFLLEPHTCHQRWGVGILTVRTQCCCGFWGQGEKSALVLFGSTNALFPLLPLVILEPSEPAHWATMLRLVTEPGSTGADYLVQPAGRLYASGPLLFVTWACCVSQAGLQLDSPAPASQVPRLQV